MIFRQVLLDVTGEAPDAPHPHQIGGEELAPHTGVRSQELHGLFFPERDMALFLACSAFEDRDGFGLIERVDQRVERGEHEAFAGGHLERDVFRPVVAHHARREEAEHRMGRLRLDAEGLHDLQEVADVLQLFDGLFGEEARRVEIRRGVEPVADLNPGDLAVQELREDPREELTIAGGVELRATEVKTHFFAGEEHGLPKPSTGIRQPGKAGSGPRRDLTVGEAVVSASSLNYAEVMRCGSLRVYGSGVTNFRLPACDDEPTRVFNTTLTRGTIEGDLLADSAGFNRAVFGLREPTDLKLWDGTINNSNFCANADRVVLAGRVTGSCADCEELDGSVVPVDACKHEASEPLFLKSCKALEAMDDCRPTPTRMRPPLK